LYFNKIPKSLLEKLDEYEQTKEGIFMRKSMNIEGGFSWIYEANPFNDFVRKFIYQENKINSGNFELTEEVLENSKRYFK